MPEIDMISIAAQYGLAGIVIIILYLLFSNEIRYLRKSIDDLRKTINELEQAMRELRLEVRELRIDRELMIDRRRGDG